ncbi:uncharacterized protein LAESUDRAFT_650537 [Laetiporus sulphureus 93-53]|uniref:GTP-binding protein n=1 Tax=Laetiporus sulphureus 93-53 TaxID=1314785 RepID=A0A165ETE9_9APHY|nr:uncharacterized protein LAESUDRAFT_650537 [Laetiporus sulphureus 93-53]KZT07720.1 hypothetical protein LAESUDRAFT_650537 [Laetiporus sulphureus 93-53]
MQAHSHYGSTATAAAPHPANGQNHSDDVRRTKILLLGMRRSGKTCIQQVLFNGLDPKQSMYVERTMRVTKHIYDTVIPLEIWDCPGDMPLDALEGVDLKDIDTVIFVIDIQDMYQAPISKLVYSFIDAYRKNPQINLEVFVHKAEAMSDDYKIDNFRYIQGRILEELVDEDPEFEQMPINFQLTSIHDHSLHDAFSRVIQRSIEPLPYFEDLLNVFCANSQASKAFLFDIKSRLYVATDASPVDAPTHNICNDYLKMLNSFGPLYKSAIASPLHHHTSPSPRALTSQSPATLTPKSTLQILPSHSASPRLSPLPRSLVPNSPRVPGSQPAMSPADPGSASASHQASPSAKELFYPSAATALSPSTGAGTGTIITYHVITPQVALLAILPTATFEAHRGLVEYNVVFFREGVQEICEVEKEVRRRSSQG